MQFHDLPLAPHWLAALDSQGLTDPTPVQQSVWEPFRAHRDLVVQSGTGTGKTLAYLLPLFQAVDPGRKDLQGLILVPTQELAVQIQKVMDSLTKGTDLRTLLLMGGVNLARQVDMLKSKPHVVVGTPGRVLELLEKKKITGHFVSTVVLDEVDRLVDGPSLVILRAILKTTLKTRQTALFSASLPRTVEAVAAEFLRDPEVIKLDAAAPIPAGIRHWAFSTDLQGKADLLRKLVHALEPSRTLVFVNKPDQVENLAARLVHHGLKAAPLHGTLAKQDRQRALESFAKGTVTLLVASDLAARGLDIAGVTHVVHFDIPENPLDFQHRSGRTGRAGAEGLTIALATEYEEQRLRDYEKAFRITIEARGIRQGKVYEVRKP